MPVSIPLAHSATGAAGSTCGAIRAHISRKVREGVTTSTASAPFSASARSVVARIGGRSISGRYFELRQWVLISWAASSLRPQMVTERPARASTAASAVPHDPAPITVTDL